MREILIIENKCKINIETTKKDACQDKKNSSPF